MSHGPASLAAGGGAGEGAAGFAPRAVAAGYGPGAAPPDVPGLGERREAQRRAGAICSPGLSGRGVPALRGWRRSQRRRGRLAGAKDLALGCGGAHRFPDCALASPCWPRPSGRRARPLWLQRRERREGARSLLAAAGRRRGGGKAARRRCPACLESSGAANSQRVSGRLGSDCAARMGRPGGGMPANS